MAQAQVKEQYYKAGSVFPLYFFAIILMFSTPVFIICQRYGIINTVNAISSKGQNSRLKKSVSLCTTIIDAITHAAVSTRNANIEARKIIIAAINFTHHG